MTTLCTHCGFNNPPGMRFCGNCGARLEAPLVTSAGSAPAPGLKSGLTSAIPTEQLGIMIGADLMERLHQAGLEATGQRRNVTVLFTDLAGFTPLSEGMDGEDLYELIQQYIRLLMNDVYKYEGIVDKLTGDGLMALFGAPIAHENNAERAILAAMDMQADVTRLSQEVKAQLGVELSMRIGLHAGPVVVGGVGTDLMMDYTAIGNTVNLARRIEEAAPSGAILVSEAVFRQTQALFDFQHLSTLNPKGITRPVIAFRVLGARKKPGQVRGIEGLRAPMIGRDQELNQLRTALDDLTGNQRGQFVLVTGEAGLGKSRLKAEFQASFSEYPVQVLEGQSQAYRRSISYWIFLDLLHNYLGVSSSTPQLQVRERLVNNTYQALGNQAVDLLPYFEHLLSLPYSDIAGAERLRYLDAGQLRQQIFLAMRDLLLAESRRRPLLIILEDLHWVDEASLELLLFLLDTLRRAPIFILAISRQVQEGIMSRMVDWSLQHLGKHFRAIELQNLSPVQSEQLLFQLLSSPSLPEKPRAQILQHADGIPFYLEEILRMLIDQGAIQRAQGQWFLAEESDQLSLKVPDTLQGLILARFDRLERMQRKVLQVASVIGKDFTLPLLETVLQPIEPSEIRSAIEALVDREFIQPVSNELDSGFTFRHILMSDAIYDTLLRRERSRIHGLVGAAIEILHADRLESQIELLANHYRWSLKLDRALHYLILAGQRAARNNINEHARLHFETARELLPKVEHRPDQVLQIWMGLGDVLVFYGDYPVARQHYQSALQVIAGQDFNHYAAERSTLFRSIAKTFERQGDYDAALNYLKNAQEALSTGSLPYPVEYAQILNDIGWIQFQRGSFAEAQQLMQAALGLVETLDAFDTIASIYNRLGGVAYNLGEWDRAAGFLRKSIAIRESIHDEVGLATSFNNLGLLEIEMGELDNALENLTRSYRLKTRLGQPEGIAMALNNLGWLRIQRGEMDEARKELDEALELARQIGYSSLLRQIRSTFGEFYLAEQDWEQTRAVLEEVRPALVELGAHDQLLDTYRLLGEAALGAGDIPAAQQWSQKAQDLLLELGTEVDSLSVIQRGEFRRLQGMLAIKQKDWEAANRYLRESETVFQKLRSRLYQGRVVYQFGALAETQGDRRSARMRFREAALLFQSVGARLEAKRADEAFGRQL